jgi:succinate dehydrogenase / fumarate reductase cytochrome b subunit
MRRLPALLRTLVGQKAVMAVTGMLLIVFVVGHLVGNLKVFQGPEHFNAYAEGLRTLGAPFFGRGQFLWLVRIALLAALLLHLWSALRVTLASRAARPTGYRDLTLVYTTWGARSMRVGGVLLLGYLVYHLLDLTFGSANPAFVAGDAYGNLVASFQRVPVALAYMAAMAVLGLHLYHGVWSGLQTLGLHTAPTDRLRRGFAAGFAGLIVAGYASIPLAVLAGVVH